MRYANSMEPEVSWIRMKLVSPACTLLLSMMVFTNTSLSHFWIPPMVSLGKQKEHNAPFLQESGHTSEGLRVNPLTSSFSKMNKCEALPFLYSGSLIKEIFFLRSHMISKVCVLRATKLSPPLIQMKYN